jgi:hypothetical protein
MRSYCLIPRVVSRGDRHIQTGILRLPGLNAHWAGPEGEDGTASRHNGCRGAGREILHCGGQTLNRSPPQIPPVFCLIIRSTAMHRAPIVPDHEIAGRPLMPAMP